MKKLLTTLLFIGSLFASGTSPNHFQFEHQENGSGTLKLNLGEIEFDNHENYKKISYANTGQLFEVGMPDLPTFSTLYMVDKNVEYNVEYQINDSYSIENIDLIPYFENDDKKQVLKGNQLNLNDYTQLESYPNNQLNVSEPKIFRDLNVISVEFIPFKYFPEEKRLEVYNDVDITIAPLSTVSDNSDIKYSRPFVKMYESLVPNFTRTEGMEFQQPAILFIGGGNALSNSHVEDLIDWRHKQGYVIYTASTSQTGTSSNNIKNYIEDAFNDFDPKPEFVTLLGDVSGGSYNIPSFTESWSGYSGSGDNPYGLLDGDDLYPDAIVGRISASSASGMATVVNKILYYEKATFIEQTGTEWYERSALAGDPSASGTSTIITNMYINNMMDQYGVENVSTQYSSGWASFMSNKLSEGTLFLNYRGYIGVSGFGASQINNANNGFMLPFATVLTCGTGNYSNGEALSESFFEAGSENLPKGAIASVGTATSGTHTMYNNIVNMGMYWGLFPGKAETAGESLVHGKLHLIKTYPTNYNNNVNIFSHWNNLMGDPATHLWTDTPQDLNVMYNQNLSLGSNFIEIEVNDENNNPVEGALVTLLMGDDVIFESKMTNPSGMAFFHIENIPEGNMDVTVIKRNHIPHEGSISVNDSFLSVNAVSENINIYDDGNAWPLTGNNDGMLNPGETVQIEVPIKNYGFSTESNLTIELTADNDVIEIVDNATTTISNLASNEETTVSFIVTLDASAIDGEELGLRLRVSDFDINESNSYLPIHVYAGRLIVNSFSYLSGNGIDPGESKLVSVELKNIGNISVNNISASIIAPPNTITVEDINFEWDLVGNGLLSSSNFVQISANENIINGTVIPVQLHLTNNSGYDREVPLHIQVGVATIEDPLGPDQHGYYIYDHGDLGYNLAGIYDWVEIDPNYGGNGVNLNLNDSGDGNPSLQQTTTVELPFDFSFYGVEYDQVSICTNGWISFGESDMTSFRNYSIPGAGGPSPMIAAFWDDLKTSSGDVFTFYDQSNDTFIIEWSDMRTYNHNDENDFQIILYNTLTPTGDGEIKIQYKTFNNTSTPSTSGWAPSHGAYATIGIENHLGDDGLEYTFHNQYPETALPLDDETAIFISTRPAAPLTMGDVDQDGIINIVDVVQIVNHILNPSLDLLSPTQSYVADLNQDSVVNIFDIIIIINIILG